MINFKNGEDTIRVRFRYKYGKKVGKAALQRIGNRRITTEAEVSSRNAAGEWRTLSVGESHRHPLDQFVKSVGRRRALQAATKQLNNKELQIKIWDEYFNVCSDGAELMIPDLT